MQNNLSDKKAHDIDMHPKSKTLLEVHILMTKKGQAFRKRSPEFKVSVIMDMRENHLGLRETGRKYNISPSVITKWECIFFEEGAEGLMKERRGRACSASGTRKGRLPKPDKIAEEDLIAENQRLRMEIEYLENWVP